MNTLNEIADAVHANAKEKGFHVDEPEIVFMANQCNNMNGELAELWDSYRAGKENEICDKPQTGLTCKEEELADLLIRVLDVSRRVGIDIQKAVERKHAYNKTRPYKHGKKN